MPRPNRYVFIYFDVFAVIVAYALSIWIKPGENRGYYIAYLEGLALFMLVWIFCSILFGKYKAIANKEKGGFYRASIISNLFAFALIASLMYVTRIDYYSRLVVLGITSIASTIELLFGAMFLALVTSPKLAGDEALSPTFPKQRGRWARKETLPPKSSNETLKTRERALLIEISKNAFDFIFSYARIDSAATLIVNTTSRFNIEAQLTPQFDAIVNVKRINDVRYINKFFEAVNGKLPVGGLFVGYVETKNLRKIRLLAKFPPGINYIYYFFDYLFKRVFPKFWLTKKIYFFLTGGHNRVITRAETFGRLYSCGFEMMSHKVIDSHLWFVARKIKEPLYPENPSYGLFVRLERVGKNGKLLRVFKLRTMHPFAEYLQEFIYEQEGLEKGGKIKDDYRISSIGRLFRIFWIDELPMLINLLKGDIKLVGVRPLSRHYFSLYTPEMKERRIKYKPGLVPPFYVDFPRTFEEIMASEKKYLDAYDKHPLLTDFRYFFIALYNILIKRYRSR